MEELLATQRELLKLAFAADDACNNVPNSTPLLMIRAYVYSALSLANENIRNLPEKSQVQ